MQATNSNAPELHHGDAWLYSCDPHFYASDEFAITYQKVVVCPKRQPHSWVDCPFAHIGEKAKRRDLRFFAYTPELCQDAKRNIACPRGDACSKSHHVYESWLHPQLYRTRMCAAGIRCMRPVCFFAHTREQLRQPSKPVRGQTGAQLIATAAAAAAAAAAAGGGAAVAGTSAAASAARVLSPQPMTQQQQQQLVLPPALISSVAALALPPAGPDAAAAAAAAAVRAASPACSASAILQHASNAQSAAADFDQQRRSMGQILMQPPPPLQRLGSSGGGGFSSHSPAPTQQRLSPNPAAAAARGGSAASLNRQQLGINGAPSPQQQLGATLHPAWGTPSGDALQLQAAALAAALAVSGSTADTAAGSARPAADNSNQQQLLQQQMHALLPHRSGYADVAAASVAPVWDQHAAASTSSGTESSTAPFPMHPLAAAQLTPAAIAAAAATAAAAAAAARAGPAGALLHGTGPGVQAEDPHRLQHIAQAAAAAAAAQQLQLQQRVGPSPQHSMMQAYLQGQAAAAAQQQQQLLLQQQEAWQGLLQADMQDLVPLGLPVSTPASYAVQQQQQQQTSFAAATSAGLAGLHPVAQLNSAAEAQLAAAQQQQRLLLMAAAASDPAAAAALAAIATNEADPAGAAALHLQRYGCSQQ